MWLYGMNLNIDKGVECLIEAYQHLTIGYTFELEHTNSGSGRLLDILTLKIWRTLHEARQVKENYQDFLRESKCLSEKLDDVIRSLIEIRRIAHDRTQGIE